MLSSKRMRASAVLGPTARTLVIAFTVSAAGCSADVTRFDFSGSGGRNTTSSIPVPPEPVRSSYNDAPNAQPRGLGLTEGPLPPASEPPPGYRPASYDQSPPPFAGPPPEPAGNYRVVGRQYKTPPPQANPNAVAPPPAAPFQGPPPARSAGDTTEVQQGETLYSIGRRYGVSAAAIRDANGLTNDTVRPGQRLTIPTQLASHTPPPAAYPPPENLAARQPLPVNPSAEAFAPTPAPHANVVGPAVAAPQGWGGRYTMRHGDSLYAIAQRHRVTLDELQRANGIADPTKVRAGTVLNVPGNAADPATPPQSGPPTPPRVINVQPEIVQPESARQPSVTKRTDLTDDAADVRSKFSWPVRGRMLAGFGRRPDGTQNDGVNIAVPQGTEIRAADSGKVAYAGNELKSFGNLVLVRHNNGWVTAYAHADRVLVKTGDEVQRGQVIARAGRTGAVDQPQVHFELRQGSRPIDPMPYLAE